MRKLSFTVLVFLFFCISYSVCMADNKNIKDEAINFAAYQADHIISLAKTQSKEKFLDCLNTQIDNLLAVKYMAMWSLGNNREFFNDSQKEQFIDAFKEYLVKFYGGVLYDYRYNKFSFSNARQLGSKDAIVEYEVNLENQKFTIAWRIAKNDKNQLLVIDVIVNGIDFLQAKRSEYADLLKKDNNIDKFINDIKNPLQNS